MPVRRVLLVSLLVLASFPDGLRAQLHNFGWINLQGGKTVASTKCVASDNRGSSFFAGTMNGVVNFGGVTLTPHGVNDAFLGKLNNAGLLVWAAQLGAQSSAQPSAIALDNAGNLYMTGIITDSIPQLVPHIFIAKFDTAGNLVWKLVGDNASSSVVAAIGLAISQSGRSIYFAGSSTNGALFEGFDSVPHNVRAGIYTIRLDSAGRIKWLKTDTATARALCIDSSENIYIGGGYATVNSIGGTKVTPAKTNLSFGFAASYDSAGKIRWVKGLDSVSPSTMCYANGYLYSGNQYTSGTGPMVIASRIAAGGSAVKYLRNSNGAVPCTNIVTDGLGYVYITGPLLANGQQQNIIIDTVKSLGGSCYIMRMDTALRPRWITSWYDATTLSNYTPCVAVDTSRGLVIGGTITGQTRFGTTSVTAKAQTNGFVAQLTLQDLSFSIPPQGVICAGDTLYVSVHTQGPFYQANMFDVQLSDSLGKFTNYTHIAKRTADGSTMISCYIPTTLHSGSKYRVRIASSSPIITTLDNGANLALSSPPNASISPDGVISLCEGDSIRLIVSGGTAVLWSTGDTARSVVVTKSGVYSAMVMDPNGCVARPLAANVTVHPIPPTPAISRAGDVLFSNAFANNQWNLNGKPIAGATKQSYTPTVSGSYSVTVSNEFKCAATSDAVDVQLGESSVATELAEDIRFVGGTLYCATAKTTSIRISNLLGVTVADLERDGSSGEIDLSETLRMLPSGVYYLHSEYAGRSFNFRFINQH